MRQPHPDENAVHLLAAALHDGQLVIAQKQVEAKSNEIPAFAPLISGLDLRAVVVTADALHTQTDHARQVVAAEADQLFIIKGHQPTLHRQPKDLPWRDVPLNHRTKESAHGRGEIRRLKACTVRPGLLFPTPPRPSRSNSAAPTARPARRSKPSTPPPGRSRTPRPEDQLDLTQPAPLSNKDFLYVFKGDPLRGPPSPALPAPGNGPFGADPARPTHTPTILEKHL